MAIHGFPSPMNMAAGDAAPLPLEQCQGAANRRIATGQWHALLTGLVASCAELLIGTFCFSWLRATWSPTVPERQWRCPCGAGGQVAQVWTSCLLQFMDRKLVGCSCFSDRRKEQFWRLGRIRWRRDFLLFRLIDHHLGCHWMGRFPMQWHQSCSEGPP